MFPGDEKYAASHQGPVARSLVCANRWLRGVKTYRFPWYLTLVSANHGSSNPGQVYILLAVLTLSCMRDCP